MFVQYVYRILGGVHGKKRSSMFYTFSCLGCGHFGCTDIKPSETPWLIICIYCWEKRSITLLPPPRSFCITKISGAHYGVAFGWNNCGLFSVVRWESTIGALEHRECTVHLCFVRIIRKGEWERVSAGEGEKRRNERKLERNVMAMKRTVKKGLKGRKKVIEGKAGVR